LCQEDFLKFSKISHRKADKEGQGDTAPVFRKSGKANLRRDWYTPFLFSGVGFAAYVLLILLFVGTCAPKMIRSFIQGSSL